MAKNFNNAGSSQIIKDVAKASALKANVINIKMISNENLIDYAKNNEDVENTEDLEKSINELGFIDPIEVTDFETEKGKYTIVSGHRRRKAGLKCKIEIFPCIIRSFNSASEVANYVLLANSQRDSAKDPLLFCNRYKMHEEYLIENGFKGNKLEEIAKRLGISVAQSSRYKQFNKVILPVWDLVRNEVVGMSSVVPLATFEVNEQEEIMKIFEECIHEGDSLTRDRCKKIIDSYKEGKKNYFEIKQNNIIKETKNDNIVENINTNTIPYIEPKKMEIDEDLDEKKIVQQDVIDIIPNNELQTLENSVESDENIKTKKDILKYIDKLNTCFNNVYSFKKEEAKEVIEDIGSLLQTLINEMHIISKRSNETNIFKDEIEKMKEKINKYLN